MIKYYLIILMLFSNILYSHDDINNKHQIIYYIKSINKEILNDRINYVHNKNIKYLINKYKVDKILKHKGLDKSLESLNHRIRPIPISLLLAIYILETGNGSNRFYIKYNSLFSEKVYNSKTKVYSIKKFNTQYDSIRSVMILLNTHNAYWEFRINRDGKLLSEELTKYLYNYSVTDDYSDRLNKVIMYYNLYQYD